MRRRKPGRRRRWAWIVGAVALGLVATSLAAWQLHFQRTKPGTLVTSKSAVTGDRLEVRLPVGTLRVVVSATRESVGGKSVRGSGRFVGVSWQLVPDTSDTTPVRVAGVAKPVRVTLVADGTRIRLRDASDKARTNYVALTDPPAKLTLDVDYDGHTQTFDPRTETASHGLAAPYYDPRPELFNGFRAKGCKELRLKGRRLDFRKKGRVACAVQAIATVPYVDRLGWAAKGRSWLVVPVTTQAELPVFAYWPSIMAPNPIAIYDLRLVSTRVTLDGKAPAATLPFYQEAPAALQKLNASGAYYVFDVTGGRHRASFRQVYRDTLTARERKAVPKAPRRKSATARFTIAIDAA